MLVDAGTQEKAEILGESSNLEVVPIGDDEGEGGLDKGRHPVIEVPPKGHEIALDGLDNQIRAVLHVVKDGLEDG